MGERKVRTPQGRIPSEREGASVQADATDSVAESKPLRGETRSARVKGWGKSPPADE